MEATSTLGKRRLSSPPTHSLPQKPKLDLQDGTPEQQNEAGPSSVLARLPHPLVRDGRSPFAAHPPFQQPAPIATFSFDENRELHHDDRSKKYYRGPPPPAPVSNPRFQRGPPRGADLNYGFDRYVQRNESVPEHLDALLDCLLHRGRSRGDADLDRARADLITWRGIMTKICTAFNQYAPQQHGHGQRPNGDSFELNAMVVQDTLYLEEYTSPARKADKAKQDSDERLRRFGYYGYSFESYCTVDHPEDVRRPFGSTPTRSSAPANLNPNPYSDRPAEKVRLDPPGWSGDVNTNVQWCQVVKTKLGSHRLILGGEVDCAQIDPQTKRETTVELKTSMRIRPASGPEMSDALRFETKLLKFYMQSFLLGIPKIVVGFRDPQGYILTHQEFETLSIPRLVRAGPGREQSVWEPKDSLGFGNSILDWAKDIVRSQTATSHGAALPTTEEGLKSYPVFRISFVAPFHEVTIRRLEPDEVEAVKDHGSSGERVGFLTRRYYEWVQEQQ